MAIDHGDLAEGLQQRLRQFGIVGPEVPALAGLLQGRLREHDDWQKR
jgi:hypothetical protein